jgi:glutathione synthase/RimK-type ligase-like ATP-grasp enzyme
VLDGRPLYACKYFMAPSHWQIVSRSEEGAVNFGRVETVPVAAAPEKVLHAALRASRLIGDGLYGVDIKERDGRCLVIEVNDNPNIDEGIEDAAEGRALYDRLAESFLRRVEQRTERAGHE